ncbi:Glucose-6-phosphate_isomerase [Hexamita inflata]|uniref:Glucose-6-phosphate isomerase n=1 Tax=Hexamita inflata TaxID=28002 RepID=A0AA86NBU2_9EUKA|nr:Glucose-6-phosphate isomerase [Hexamita inflata]
MQTFFDETLDISIQTNMSYDAKLYEYNFKAALAKIQQIESGAIANATAVPSESENRPVDHYNLRMKEEKVAGKSLAKTVEQWQLVKKFAEANMHKFKHVVFNGIGGSYLGPYMLIQAINGDEFNSVQQKENRPSLHFVANTDSDSFTQLFTQIDINETLMVVISKSGATAETATNTQIFSELLKDKAPQHMAAITIPGSNLHKKAANWLATFEMNESTGGRTSIGSAVAMVPCAFANIDFEQFANGMCQMDEATRRANNNPAFFISALIDQFLQKSAGPRNMIILGYADSLKHYYHYCQQLYMESLGKQYTHDGRFSPRGLTVYGGIGTAEQHAFMQQIQKGVQDSFVKFIQFNKRRFQDYKDEKAGTMGRQLLAFLKGTEAALDQNGRQFMTVSAKECSPFCIGQLIALEERIVTVLAAFWDLNAYDQPGVQDGKLAAGKVNKTSIQLDKLLVPVENLNAEQIMKKLDMNDNAQLITDLLNDMVFNPASYTNGLKGERKFVDGQFVFTFRK